jgi:hypothetical protein
MFRIFVDICPKSIWDTTTACPYVFEKDIYKNDMIIIKKYIEMALHQNIDPKIELNDEGNFQLMFTYETDVDLKLLENMISNDKLINIEFPNDLSELVNTEFYVYADHGDSELYNLVEDGCFQELINEIHFNSTNHLKIDLPKSTIWFVPKRLLSLNPEFNILLGMNSFNWYDMRYLESLSTMILEKYHKMLVTPFTAGGFYVIDGEYYTEYEDNFISKYLLSDKDDKEDMNEVISNISNIPGIEIKDVDGRISTCLKNRKEIRSLVFAESPIKYV